MSETGHPRGEPGGPLAGWKMQASSSDIGLTNTLEEVRRLSTLNKFLVWFLQQRFMIYSGQAGRGTTACEVHQNQNLI